MYAFLMSQPPIRAVGPRTKLAFPFGLRSLVAVWNALYLEPGPTPVQQTHSETWNRGAYLVEGLGHCAACHSPRNLLGAEKSGSSYLSGAMVDGWEAPALTSLSAAPVAWTEDELFRYLRFGSAREHGVAAGPMAPVVAQLAALPEGDVRAIAHYIASFNAPAGDTQAARQEAIDRSRTEGLGMMGETQRLFSSACGACHHEGNGPMYFGQNLPLALNTNLHSSRPDNLLRSILDGIRVTGGSDNGFMPAFRDALDDRQIARLAAYMRRRFAPDKPAWTNVEASVARLRADL
jgi:nicotinate dehydrogenase subunit B